MGDGPALAGAVHHLLDQPVLRTALARRAPDRARQFDLSSHWPEMGAVYDECLTRRCAYLSGPSVVCG